jgi:anti-anti-sigma regulatory factor
VTSDSPPGTPHDRSPGPVFSQEVDCRAGVVRGRGLLTASTAGLLRATVEALVRGGHPRVLLDLSDLRDADEPGLRAISSLAAGVEESGGRLTVLPWAAPRSS